MTVGQVARGSDSPAAPQRGRPARLRTGAAWLALVLAGALLTTLTLVRGGSPSPAPRLVVASLPYWNITNGTAVVLAHRQDVTEVSPWMYGLARDGRIGTQYPAGHGAAVEAALTRLRAAGLAIVPTLANITAGRWSYPPVARILHHPQLMKRHVAAIAALVRRHRYAGIDIDYENLRAGDRHAFTAFTRLLASALHAQHKVLSVAVFAKTSNAGSDPRNLAQDYAALGHAADQMRIMAYDYHWATSPPGPVAPLGWVRSVLRYAKSQMPNGKIVLGVPLYGYDWSGGRGVAVSWLRAFQLSRRYHARPHYDTASQQPWLRYTDASGRKHVVWFENQASSRALFGTAQGSAVRGVFLWMFGYEDAGTWAALRQVLPVHVAPSPAATAGKT